MESEGMGGRQNEGERGDSMPSSFSYLDVNFPTFTAGEDTESKIDSIQSYLYMLMEQLRYSLNNLDERNFNEKGLQNITEPLYARIEDSEGYIAELALNAENLRLGLYGENGDITTLQATASGLQSSVSSLNGSVSTLTQTTSGLQSSVSSLNGNVSTLTQTVNGMTLSVSNGEASSTISLVRNGVSVSSQTIRFTGGVVFESDLKNGNTTINGSCISTGHITSEFIEITGALSTYAGDGGDLTGYLGYVEGTDADGDTTYGIGMTAINTRKKVRGQCYVTESGARLAYAAISSVTCTDTGYVSMVGDYIQAETGNVKLVLNNQNSAELWFGDDYWVFEAGSIYWSKTGKYVQLG